MDRIKTFNLSEDLIGKLAQFLREDYLSQGKDLSRLAFVFGGKRPGMFLKRRLSESINKGFFPPQFFSVDDFMDHILNKRSAFSMITDLDAAFLIYKLARKIAPEILANRESFSHFLPWAREILGFIEQLDLEDIRPDALKNIQSQAEIGFDVPENINALLESIIAIREAFHEHLLANNTYSRGLKYLTASRLVKETEFLEFERVFFCGLFYLHKTELAIVKYLYDADKAVLFFHGDESQWSVLKKLGESFGSRISSEIPEKESYALSIQAGFDVHSEASLCAHALKSIADLNDTVIVLPQPGSLIPLLSEVSSCAEEFNVSMGYPLKRSVLYLLFACVFNAQKSRKGNKYYAKDYLKALSNPLAKNLDILPDADITRVLVHKIEEILTGIEKTELGGSLFIELGEIEHSKDLFDLALSTMKAMRIEVTRDELKNAVLQLHRVLFGLWEEPDDFSGFARSLDEFLGVLVKNKYLCRYPLNYRMLQKAFEIKDELSNASFSKEKLSKDEIFRIFDDKILNEEISFSGSPLKGLQILGLMETRSLSFKNVLIMDVNEASLPSLKIYEPLIPREVMITLGLNRLEKEEEIQRYQFRRLIAGAKDVRLIYQKRPDKEKSRFIEEIIWERQEKEKKLEVLSIPQASFKVQVLPKQLAIKKNSQILKLLKQHRYSASSVNMYMACPLQFYYKYVLGLQEKEDLLDEPESADIGTFIHEFLDEVFRKFKGRQPEFTPKFKDDFFLRLNEKFSDEFSRKMKSDSFLIKEIIDFRLKGFLEKETKRRVQKVICLEEVFNQEIKLSCGTFKFTAKIDRIDRLSDGSYLVIDYKTGAIDKLPQAGEDIVRNGLSRENIKESVRSFQLPLYLYFARAHPEIKNGSSLNAALYSLRDFSLKKLFRDGVTEDKKEAAMQVYLEALGAIMAEIVDPKAEFRATEEDEETCKYCAFGELCR